MHSTMHHGGHPHWILTTQIKHSHTLAAGVQSLEVEVVADQSKLVSPIEWHWVGFESDHHAGVGDQGPDQRGYEFASKFHPLPMSWIWV